jgi:hypothetical protein
MNEQQEKWRDLQDKINAAIAEWPREHPEATLAEIEEVVDSQIAHRRTKMVDVIQRQIVMEGTLL